MKAMNDKVRSYVMTDLVWKADLPAFLKEVAECSRNTAYKSSFKCVMSLLDILTERAIEINDPALNIIMLNLSLYEGSHSKNIAEIKAKLREQINNSR